MARPLRIQYEGALYHVTSRGNAGQRIFFDDRDRTHFLDVLAQAVERFQWICHAYCLMPNHYHLLLETPQGNLSRGMRHLNGVYTQGTNRRHKRSGHLFQGRFKAILVEKDSYLLQVARYIVLNPVRGKMVRSPGDWPWSSYLATLGEAVTPGFLSTKWLLEAFSEDSVRARSEYLDFVKGGVGISLWDGVRGGILLGREDFAERLKQVSLNAAESKEFPRSERLLLQPPLDELLRGTETDKGLRDERIYEAVRLHDYRLSDVGAALGLHYSTISRIVKQVEIAKGQKTRPDPNG